MIEVDARGLSCPEPVMLANQAVKAHPGEQICVLVDEACALTNVEKFGKSKGKSVHVTDKGSGEFQVDIK